MLNNLVVYFLNERDTFSLSKCMLN